MKTLEFLNSRRPDLEMRPSFLRQLQLYEGKLIARGLGPKSQRWNELSDTATYHLENDEVILRNTYLNSQCGPMQYQEQPLAVKQDTIKWRDMATSNKQLLWEENLDKDDLVNL